MKKDIKRLKEIIRKRSCRNLSFKCDVCPAKDLCFEYDGKLEHYEVATIVLHGLLRKVKHYGKWRLVKDETDNC